MTIESCFRKAYSEYFERLSITNTPAHSENELFISFSPLLLSGKNCDSGGSSTQYRKIVLLLDDYFRDLIAAERFWGS